MDNDFNSVCMATYNGEKFVEEQINSILKQIGPRDEVVISDDGSTDRTVTIIKSIKDSRIRLLRGGEYKDPIKNFQHALVNCKGKYIFLSDQDDVWMNDKYQIMLDYLQDFDLIISDSEVVDEELNVLHSSFFNYFKSGKGILKNIIKSSYYGSCMAFDRKVLEMALPFPDTKEIGHDLWIGLVAEMKFSVFFLDKALIKYRRHASTFTPLEVGKSKRSFLQIIRGRLIMFAQVLKFLLKSKKIVYK